MLTCPKCGVELPADTPAESCPNCILSFAVADSDTVAQIDGETRPLLPAGKTFGDYELIEEIARGGMGIVYKARQVSLHRIVAVKMILAGQFASQQIAQRFKGEAVAAAVLHHPNIVAVHDVGVQDGQHFFSMDFVEGQNLAQLVGSRPLAPAKAARYVKLIAEAIHYAHQQGILHRDLKPSNVLVDAATDQPRVTDFGLAKRLDGESSLTVTGQVLGSPNFMPPEQAGGNRGKVGRHSDVYGLGAILFYTLTARAPFQGATLETTLHEVLNTEPLSPRALNPSVPRDLETICLKCLEKEPAKRYPTAQAFAEELDRFLNDEPIHACPVTRTERAWRWCRRKPVVASLSATTALLLLVIAVGSPVALFRIDRARKAEIAARQRAEAEALNARRSLYVSDMNQALQVFAEGKLERVRELLELHRPTPEQKEDLPAFEWLYLWKESRGDELFSLPKQNSPIFKTAFSPDGQRLLVGADSGNVTLWDVPLRRELGSLIDSSFDRALDISHDGKTVALATKDSRIRLLDLGTMKEKLVLTNSVKIFDLKFSPDSQTLASAHSNQVTLWKLSDGSIRKTFPIDPIGRRTPHLAVSSNWTTFATAGGVHAIKLWDGASGSLIGELIGHTADAADLAFSPDGQRLASVGWDRTVRVWDVQTRRQMVCLTNHAAWVGGVAFSHVGRMLATASADSTIRLWDMETFAELAVLRGHEGEVWPVAFAPNGQTLVSGGRTGEIKIWSAIPRRILPVLPLVDVTNVLTTGFTPDGIHCVTFHRDGRLQSWDVATLRPAESQVVDATTVRCATFSPGSNLLALGRDDGEVRLWDLKKRLFVAALTLGTSPVTFLGFSGDGTYLIARNANAVRAWAFFNGTEAKEIAYVNISDQIPGGDSLSLALSKGGRLLASGNADLTLTFRNLATTSTQTVQPNQDGVLAMQFAPDGQTLVTVGENHRVKLWDAENGRELGSLKNSLQAADGVCFSPDGRRLAVASGEGILRLWDTTTLREVAAYTMSSALESRPGAIQFSPDGQSLMALVAQGMQFWRAARFEEVNGIETNEIIGNAAGLSPPKPVSPP